MGLVGNIGDQIKILIMVILIISFNEQNVVIFVEFRKLIVFEEGKYDFDCLICQREIEGEILVILRIGNFKNNSII